MFDSLSFGIRSICCDFRVSPSALKINIFSHVASQMIYMLCTVHSPYAFTHSDLIIRFDVRSVVQFLELNSVKRSFVFLRIEKIIRKFNFQNNEQRKHIKKKYATPEKNTILTQTRTHTTCVYTVHTITNERQKNKSE